MVCARTALTCGAASNVVTIGYVTWSSMMSGGSPAQGTCTITWTSEMSGRASSGIFLSDQMPARTSSKVPVKTRNRLLAHQSITREIMATFPFVFGTQFLGCKDSSALDRRDGELPRAFTIEICSAFVNAAALLAQGRYDIHCSHAHLRHTGQVAAHADLRARDGRALG